MKIGIVKNPKRERERPLYGGRFVCVMSMSVLVVVVDVRRRGVVGLLRFLRLLLLVFAFLDRGVGHELLERHVVTFFFRVSLRLCSVSKRSPKCPQFENVEQEE